MEYENLTFVEALEQLAEQAGMELPAKSDSAADKKRRDMRDSILEVNKLAAGAVLMGIVLFGLIMVFQKLFDRETS